MCLSIFILCFPDGLRRVFLIVCKDDLVNHSRNVTSTNSAVSTPSMPYWNAMFQAKFFSEICVMCERFLILVSSSSMISRLVTKYLTLSQIWKTSASSRSSPLNVFLVYFRIASSFSTSSFSFSCRYWFCSY